MTFRTRLLGGVLLVTALTLGIAFSIVALAFNQMREAHMDEALLRTAESEANKASDRVSDDYVFRDTDPAAAEIGPLSALIYSTEDGRVMAKNGIFAARAPETTIYQHRAVDPFNFHHEGQHLRGVFVILPHRRNELLLLASSRADLDYEERFLARAMLAAFLVAVMWGGLTARWMIERITRGHQRVVEVARKVAGGDLDARIGPVAHGEIGQLAHDVDEMISRLGLLVTSQQRFIAHAAHELRSPLTALYGELQLALRKERTAEEYKEMIAEALDSSRRLKMLAEDLLTLARMGGDDQTPREEVDVGALASHAVKQIEPLTEERGVTVQVSASGVRALGRPRDLERLARNLIENAVNHSPKGGVVEVTAEARDGTIELAVVDAGPGVPEPERERIFEPFYRSAQSRATAKGSGLGLGIAREIARAHGGDIAVGDRKDGSSGARFVARLPAG
jgi:two-component system heavy metal sensor histidine kinase CusS